MNIFQQAINDIFSVPEFIDCFTDEHGNAITCIQYSINTETLYTQFGYDNGESFYLSCKCADYTPTRGAKIVYHDKTYKIKKYTQDGFNLTYNIFIQDLTTK